MKNFLSIACLLFIVSCGNKDEKKPEAEIVSVEKIETEVQTPEISTEDYLSFGEKFVAENVLSAEEMHEKFQDLKVGDTLNLTFQSKANDVCVKKGCWMKLDLADGEESMVRFEDYSFFVPTDSKGNEFIVHGKAYITELSVEKLRHYAEDGGKSEAEIAAITEPERTLAFEADGVLMKP